MVYVGWSCKMTRRRGGINHTSGSLYASIPSVPPVTLTTDPALIQDRARGKAKTSGHGRQYGQISPKRRPPVALFPPKVLITTAPRSSPSASPKGQQAVAIAGQSTTHVDQTSTESEERVEKDWLLDSDLAFARRAAQTLSSTVTGPSGTKVKNKAWWDDLNTAWREGRRFERKFQKMLKGHQEAGDGTRSAKSSWECEYRPDHELAN